MDALCSSENYHYHAVEGLKLFTFSLSSPTLTPGGASPSFPVHAYKDNCHWVILLCRACAFLHVNQDIIHFLLCVHCLDRACISVGGNKTVLLNVKFYSALVEGVWPRAPKGWPAYGFSLALYKDSEVSGKGWGDSMLWPSWRVQPQIIINWLFKKSCKLFFLSVCLKLLLINFSHVPTHHLGWIIDLTVPVFCIPEIHRPPVLWMQLGGSGSEEVGQLSWNSEIFRNCCNIEKQSRAASASNSCAAQFPAMLLACTLPTDSRSRHLWTRSFVPSESPLFGLQCLGHTAFFPHSRACFFVTLLIAKGQLSRL